MSLPCDPHCLSLSSHNRPTFLSSILGHVPVPARWSLVRLVSRVDCGKKTVEGTSGAGLWETIN